MAAPRNTSGDTTIDASVAAAVLVFSANSRRTKKSAACVTKTTSASVARPPSTWMKSARASRSALVSDPRRPSPSTRATGTARPKSDSQTRPGRMKNATSNVKGTNTSTPTPYARNVFLLRSERPVTIEHATT